MHALKQVVQNVQYISIYFLKHNVLLFLRLFSCFVVVIVVVGGMPGREIPASFLLSLMSFPIFCVVFFLPLLLLCFSNALSRVYDMIQYDHTFYDPLYKTAYSKYVDPMSFFGSLKQLFRTDKYISDVEAYKEIAP